MKEVLKKCIALLVAAVCLVSVVCIASPESQAANNYEKDIFYFLKNEMGMNDAAACGIVANIEKESGFDPYLYGDSGTSYGICQWHAGRFDSLRSFCADNGYDYRTVTGQLYFLKHELETLLPNTLKDIKSVENTEEGAYYAGYSFCYNFERPSNREYKSEQRGELAKKYWEKYGVLPDITPQKITSPASGKKVSSADSVKIKWSAGSGSYNRNRLHIVRQYEDGSYDWDSEQTVITTLNTLCYTFTAGTLSDGNYLIWVEPWYLSKSKAGPASKPITITVYDKLFYETETDISGSVFDASAGKSVDISGWVVDSGVHPVKVSFSLDGAEYVSAEKTKRKDIASSKEYGKYCPDNNVGFTVSMPLSDLSNGKHKVSVKAEGDSVSKIIGEYTFTVINGHDHSFTKYVSNKDASCFADGTKTAKCNLCRTKNTITDKGTKIILGTAKDFTATAKDTSVVLSWQDVDHASYYRVYVNDSGWKAIAEVGESNCTVTNLVPSQKYSFAVKACYEDDRGSVMAPKYVTVSTVTLPSNLTTLTSSVTPDSVTLSWNKSAGATGYRIYIYNNGTKKWDIALKATHKTTAVISGLETSKSYRYAVRPYYNSGDGIIWASKYISKTITATLDTPELKALHSSAKGRVTISWSKVTPVDGYQVWVSDSEKGTYKKVSNFSVRSTYLYGYESGQTCYFKVRAYKKIDGVYVYSDCTAPKAVKIK